MPRLLLVDDDAMNRDMLSRRLLKNGYEVSMACDGSEAVELAASGKFDLVLMDIGLPDFDGWEATRKIRANSASARTPVIALTAHAAEHHPGEAEEAGCDDFDTKPVDLPRLLNKIESLLARRDQR